MTCCKALLATAYLDGGYGAVRAMLGPWVVEVLRAAPERELQVRRALGMLCFTKWARLGQRLGSWVRRHRTLMTRHWMRIAGGWLKQMMVV